MNPNQRQVTRTESATAEFTHGGPSVTVRQALVRARASLAPTSDTPRLDAEILLAQALGWSRTRLHAHPAASLDPRPARRFEMQLERRRAGEPIAYLTGRREFWSLDLLVTPDTLVPRPETEHLVEAVLQVIPADRVATIADIGTGAGTVALALAVERPRARVLGTDRSRAAVEVACENAARLHIPNVTFAVADTCRALAPLSCSVIVSNPPYVADNDPRLGNGAMRFEPREALLAGPRGMDMLRALAREAPASLAPDGWLVLEHSTSQAPAVRALFALAGLRGIRTIRDLAGHDRVSMGHTATRPTARGSSPSPFRHLHP